MPNFEDRVEIRKIEERILDSNAEMYGQKTEKLSWNDWRRWVKGLVGAAISGTSAAISSGVSVSLIAPDKFNLGSELGNLIKMVLATAGVAFVVSVSKYLKDHPLPEDLPE